MTSQGSAAINLDHCYEVVMGLMDVTKNLFTKHLIDKPYMEAVLEIHTLIMNGLHDAFPTHSFIAEDIKTEKIRLSTNPTWVIDPLDGAINFAHSFPHSCVSIALLNNKITEIGIIYNPILGQRFTARRGKGAFLNGKTIMTSGQNDIRKSLITTEYASSRNLERSKIVCENIARMIKIVDSVRSLGSSALNLVMVGLGAADANYEMGVHLWDIAAAELIVREAGGVVIDPNGGEFDLMSRRILGASSISLAQSLSKHLSQYYPLPRDD